MNALFCLFAELDANSDGLLQWEDFHGATKPAFHHPFIPQALCRAFDPDGSGYVDFAQFARYSIYYIILLLFNYYSSSSYYCHIILLILSAISDHPRFAGA